MQKANLTYTRSLFPPGYSIHFDIDMEPLPFSIPGLADAILTDFLPAEALRGDPTVGLKGRGAWTGTKENGSVLPEEEILYIEGRLLPDEKESAAAEGFLVRLKTSFSEFVGAKEIAHKVRVERSGSIFDALEIQELGRALPLEIARVRLGVDIFEGTFVGSFFGFAPVVRKSFLIDGDVKNLRVEVDLEGVRGKESGIFKLHPLLAKIPPLVDRITGGDLSRMVRDATL